MSGRGMPLLVLVSSGGRRSVILLLLLLVLQLLLRLEPFLAVRRITSEPEPVEAANELDPPSGWVSRERAVSWPKSVLTCRIC